MVQRAGLFVRVPPARCRRCLALVARAGDRHDTDDRSLRLALDVHRRRARGRTDRRTDGHSVMRKGLIVDALATLVAGLAGTSSGTAYVESMPASGWAGEADAPRSSPRCVSCPASSSRRSPPRSPTTRPRRCSSSSASRCSGVTRIPFDRRRGRGPGVRDAGADPADLFHHPRYPLGVRAARAAAPAGRPRPRGHTWCVGAGGGLGRPSRIGACPMSSLVLDAARDEFQKIKKLGDKAIAQLSDEQLHEDRSRVELGGDHHAAHGRQHAVALDRLPDLRRREAGSHARSGVRGTVGSREALMTEWEDGWKRLFDALAPLTDVDLQRTVIIRTEPHSVYRRSAGRWRITPGTFTRSSSSASTSRAEGGRRCRCQRVSRKSSTA